jgi:hypothetical protein
VPDVDRSPRAKTPFGRTKARVHAVTAAAAMAFLAGLSGPGAAAFANEPAGHEAHSSVATTTVNQATAAAKSATANLASATGPRANPGAAPKPNAAAAPAKPTTWADINPSARDLFPEGKPAGQAGFSLSNDQLKNARTIVQTGQKLGLQPRAWVIALSTAMQESKLVNLGYLGASNDHDSLGLFQQRPASGWGSPVEINSPVYAATAFYKALVNTAGWESMSVTDAAQAVQVSAFPDAYAQWEQQAGDIISGLYGYGPYAQQAASLK